MKLLITLWSQDLDLSSSILVYYPWFSSRLKHGDDNRGIATRYGAILSHTARLPCLSYWIFADMNRSLIA